jgi:hypothetical protein
MMVSHGLLTAVRLRRAILPQSPLKPAKGATKSPAEGLLRTWHPVAEPVMEGGRCWFRGLERSESAVVSRSAGSAGAVQSALG